MEKIQHKITGGNAAKMGVISTAAIIACFSSFVASHLIKYNAGDKAFYLGKSTIAAILGGVFMLIMMKLSKNNKRLAEWNLTIAMLAAMIVTAILPFGK